MGDKGNASTVKMYGIDLPVFLFFAAVVLISCWLGIVPNS